MRTPTIPLAVSAILAITLLAGPAVALEADDAMTSWKTASPAERSALLDRLLGAGKADGKVLRCMDETSATPGHAGLPIGEVAKVCAVQADQPV